MLRKFYPLGLRSCIHLCLPKSRQHAFGIHAGRRQGYQRLPQALPGPSYPWCCAGGIIGPYLIGALSDKYSYGAAMITLGAFNLLAALLFTTFPGEPPQASCPRILLTGQGKCIVWDCSLIHSSGLHIKQCEALQHLAAIVAAVIMLI